MEFRIRLVYTVAELIGSFGSPFGIPECVGAPASDAAGEFAQAGVNDTFSVAAAWKLAISDRFVRLAGIIIAEPRPYENCRSNRCSDGLAAWTLVC